MGRIVGQGVLLLMCIAAGLMLPAGCMDGQCKGLGFFDLPVEPPPRNLAPAPRLEVYARSRIFLPAESACLTKFCLILRHPLLESQDEYVYKDLENLPTEAKGMPHEMRV
jgi:hypothetical protein